MTNEFSILNPDIIKILENGCENEAVYADFLRTAMKNITGIRKWNQMVKSISVILQKPTTTMDGQDSMTKELLKAKY